MRANAQDGFPILNKVPRKSEGNQDRLFVNNSRLSHALKAEGVDLIRYKGKLFPRALRSVINFRSKVALIKAMSSLLTT